MLRCVLAARPLVFVVAVALAAGVASGVLILITEGLPHPLVGKQGRPACTVLPPVVLQAQHRVSRQVREQAGV